MKKWMAAAMLFTAMVTFAQQKPQAAKDGARAELEKLTPEQRNALHLKELTLKLDLNASQQAEMGKVIADMDARHQALKAERTANEGKKPTPDEIFARKNKRLDEQIAMKSRLKKILTPEQLDKFEKMHHERQMQKRGKMGHRERKPKH